MNVAMTCDFFLSVHSVLFIFLLSSKLLRKGGKALLRVLVVKKCNHEIRLIDLSNVPICILPRF